MVHPSKTVTMVPPTGIIQESRVPLKLQRVLIAGNRGEVVDAPATCNMSFSRMWSKPKRMKSSERRIDFGQDAVTHFHKEEAPRLSFADDGQSPHNQHSVQRGRQCLTRTRSLPNCSHWATLAQEKGGAAPRLPIRRSDDGIQVRSTCTEPPLLPRRWLSPVKGAQQSSLHKRIPSLSCL